MRLYNFRLLESEVANGHFIGIQVRQTAGVARYSSHDFGVSMRTEVNNVDQIKEESGACISIASAKCGFSVSNPVIPSVNGNEHKQETKETNPDYWKVTERQRGLIPKSLIKMIFLNQQSRKWLWK